MTETLEVVTRYEKSKPTTYSVDSGKTWLSKQEYKQKIGGLKRPLYSNAKKKEM